MAQKEYENEDDGSGQQDGATMDLEDLSPEEQEALFEEAAAEAESYLGVGPRFTHFSSMELRLHCSLLLRTIDVTVIEAGFAGCLFLHFAGWNLDANGPG